MKDNELYSLAVDAITEAARTGRRLDEVIHDCPQDVRARLLEEARLIVERLVSLTNAEGVEAPISEDEARTIVGNEHFYGSHELELIFGERIPDVPPIPFSREELINAKKRGGKLILRINSINNKPLTVNEMHRLETSRGVRLLDEDYNLGIPNESDSFYDNVMNQHTPGKGWALVGAGVLPHSKDKDLMDQFQEIALLLKIQIFHKKTSPEIDLMLAEFETKKAEIRGLIFDREWETEKQGERKLHQLRIARMVRSPVQAVYDVLLQRRSQQRIPASSEYCMDLNHFNAATEELIILDNGRIRIRFVSGKYARPETGVTLAIQGKGYQIYEAPPEHRWTVS